MSTGVPQFDLPGMGDAGTVLAQYFAQSAVPLALTSLEGTIVHVNRPYCDLVGRTVDDLAGMRSSDLLAIETAERVAQRRAAASGGAMIPVDEQRVIRPDGSVVHALSSVTLLRDVSGRPRWLVHQKQDISGLRIAEAALRASEERLRAVIDGTPVGIAMMDPSGRFAVANAALCRIMGRDAAILAALRDIDVVHPDDRWLAGPALARMESGVPAVHERRFVRPDGDIVECRVTMVPLRAEDGGGTILAQYEDLTEARRAEGALRDVQRDLRAVLHSAPVALLTCDREGRLLQVGGGEAVMLRFGREPLGRTVEEVFRDAPDVITAMRRALAGETFTSTLAVGPWFYQATCLPRHDAEGAVSGATCIAAEVTERVRAEDRLRARERFARSILDSLTSATVVLDASGIVIATNRAWRELSRILGHDPERFGMGSVHADACTVLIEDSIVAEAAVRGLREVLALRSVTFTIDYPAPALGADTWHTLRVAPMESGGGAVVSHEDITERKRVEGEFSFQALHDALTGLPNKALFGDRTAMALARAPRRGTGCAILFVDLDRFKVVNDSLGHRAGDSVLFEVAARLAAVVRPGDTVARLGGDEFSVLCEDVDDPEQALDIAHRIIDAVEEPFILGEREVSVSASVGIALAAGPEVEVETLIHDADSAMYRAKLLGRRRAVVFDEGMRRSALARLDLEQGLRHAVSRGELVLHYQPVVQLGSRRVIGVEALVRWNRPGHGLLLPADFLAVAEESGIIEELAQWVLPAACEQLSGWRTEADLLDLRLAVNVSARDLVRPGFVDLVAKTVQRTGLEENSLTLEITESALIQDFEVAQRVLADLSRLGVGVGVDDFGTGFSSLSYLHRLPVQLVKIDRTFTAGLPHDADARALVTAVVQLGWALGLDVVAEGVETEDQVASLRDLGCALGQGFFLGRPTPADSIDSMLHPVTT